MNLKNLLIILLIFAAACSRSDPAEDADAILRAKALYQEVYAEYVTKAIHPGSAIKKLDQALGLVPEDHEYHRKILRLKARIDEKKEQPPPPDREAIDITPPSESRDPAEKQPAKEAGDFETGN